MRTVGIIAAALLLAGCSTQPNGARWYAPATWFSHAPADSADRAQNKEEAARHAAIKAAQKSAHETGFALAAAPASPPVAVASDFNASAVALLDQAAGPLEAGEIERMRRMVSGLLSENAQLKAEAQRDRDREKQSIESLSGTLAKAEQKSEAASAALRAAFDRENALANELRSQRALFWIAVVSAAMLGLGWLYVRIALGGVPVAIGRAMGDLRARHPAIAEQLTPIFDQYLNRHEQAMIARNARP